MSEDKSGSKFCAKLDRAQWASNPVRPIRFKDPHKVVCKLDAAGHTRFSMMCYQFTREIILVVHLPVYKPLSGSPPSTFP